jgi:DUF1009 family protein
MTAALGLVGGGGPLPALMSRQAREAGWRVVAFALEAPELLAASAHRIVACRLGQIEPVLEILREEGIRHVVLAGGVRKDGVFHGMSLDAAARELLGRVPDWSDEGLLRTVAGALSALGIELLDQRRFLGPWLAPAGLVAGPALAAPLAADVARGLDVAREVARRGIGQTVVVRNGSVAAVEAMEGTDAAIRRGLALAGKGAVVVKATARAHDYRFDVPTVGPETLAGCIAGGAAALAVEAGRVLLLEPERLRAAADQAGISVVGIAERAGD